MDYTNDQTFTDGDRVELHPATDAWMSGDRYAEVIQKPRGNVVVVRMDKSGRRRWFHFTSVRHVS